MTRSTPDSGLMDLAGIKPGEVRVEELVDKRGQRWLMVAIGRTRYSKRFNLRPDEAARLVELLVKHGSD